jgi:hypothetical protein
MHRGLDSVLSDAIEPQFRFELEPPEAARDTEVSEAYKGSWVKKL